MKLFIAVDVGNTLVSIGLFYDGLLKDRVSFPTDESVEENVLEFFKSHKKRDYSEVNGLISSVVPSANLGIQAAIFARLEVVLPIIHDDLKVEIPNKVEVPPHEIGADLLCDIVAAKKDYSLPAIIVDAGTVTKVLVLNKEGEFIGASFAPGLRLSLKTMGSGTELLSASKDEIFKKEAIAKNTKDCMLVGVTNQIVGGIKETISSLEEKDYTIILTGGYMNHLKDYLSFDAILDSDLTLKGIKYIFEGDR